MRIRVAISVQNLVLIPYFCGYPVVDDYGLKTVQEYMYHIRSNAELSVRNLLKDVAQRAGTNVLEAVDYLDDGSPVCYSSMIAFECKLTPLLVKDSAPRGN